MVDTSTTAVLLSVDASEVDLKLTSSVVDVNNTITSLPKKLEDYLFTQNGLSAVEVPEVAVLFSMMMQSGNMMWDAIVNNAALVPLDNMWEFFVRIYKQLHGVVKEGNRAEYNDILEELVFPLNWHDYVFMKLNGSVLLSFYKFQFQLCSRSMSNSCFLYVYVFLFFLCMILFIIYDGAMYDATASTKNAHAK